MYNFQIFIEIVYIKESVQFQGFLFLQSVLELDLGNVRKVTFITDI